MKDIYLPAKTFAINEKSNCLISKHLLNTALNVFIGEGDFVFDGLVEEFNKNPKTVFMLALASCKMAQIEKQKEDRK